MEFIKKLGFYTITIVLNIIYYACKPAELFAQTFRLGELFSHIKDVPHWIVESFTGGDEIWDDDDYLDYTFRKAA